MDVVTMNFYTEILQLRIILSCHIANKTKLICNYSSYNEPKKNYRK